MDGHTTDPIGTALTNPHTYVDRDAYHAMMAKLRREDPLYWATPEGYRPFWVVTKHADIAEIERQPDLFLSGPRLELFSIEQERKVKETTGRDAAVGRTILHMDGMEHRAYRGMSQGWFMPQNLRNMDQRLNALGKEYVDKLARIGGEADFVKEVSELFPLNVILMILGMPSDEAPELLRLTRNFNWREEAPVPPGMTREDLIIQAAQEIFDYFGKVFDARQKEPKDDVASVIANAKINGAPISRPEALSYYLLLGLAGHDTTNGTMAGGLLALIRNPDQLAKLKANPELISGAVDEMLRWVTPTTTFMRTAVQDYPLRGKTIKAGDSMILAFASGNRDEEVFENPFEFRVERKPNPQLAFGYGAHVCLGQHLAKMELRSFYKEFIARLDSIELAGEPKMHAAVTSNQLVKLPIRYKLRAEARVKEPA
jgi:cytochrome P450